MTQPNIRPAGSVRLGVIALVLALIPLVLAGLTVALRWWAFESDSFGALYSTMFLTTVLAALPLCIAAVVLGAIGRGQARSRVLGLMAILIAIIGIVALAVWFLSAASQIGR